jgi:KDO2-lipid IV(A) lauroyltransferase
LAETAARVVEVSGWELVEAASRHGKGILYLTPHLGCFEITAQYLSTHAPITVLYRQPRQAWLQALIEAGRARPQLHLAAADLSGVRSLLKALRRGEAVGMLPDQAPKAGEGRWLDFFGKPAYTMTLAARLTESGAAVIMVWAERLPAGAGYHFRLQEPTQPIRGSIEERAQQINHEIEQLVRQCPAQYLWGYNRYKGRGRVLPVPEEGGQG